MTQLHDQPLAAGELDVWVTYDLASEGSYYPELHSGFRTSIWGRKGYAAAILFVKIMANGLVPSYMYWGPLKRPFGTLALAPPAEVETYR